MTFTPRTTASVTTIPRVTARRVECIVLSSPLSELHTGSGPRLITPVGSAFTMGPCGRLRNDFSLRPDLRVRQPRALAHRAVRVVLRAQRLHVVGCDEAPVARLVPDLVYRSLVIFVVFSVARV